ncbi:MAG TPA: hypothetical protein VKQ72_03705 [Aggregatilineales bacterium]|nr:hypothetical protein [Aggregatilineales bacterium]
MARPAAGFAVNGISFQTDLLDCSQVRRSGSRRTPSNTWPRATAVTGKWGIVERAILKETWPHVDADFLRGDYNSLQNEAKGPGLSNT